MNLHNRCRALTRYAADDSDRWQQAYIDCQCATALRKMGFDGAELDHAERVAIEVLDRLLKEERDGRHGCSGNL